MDSSIDRTIAAVSSGLTESGISVIRISGPKALEIADRVFLSPGRRKKLCGQKTHTIHYGHAVDADGNVLDEVLVSVMRAPRTYTREDTVEFNCHGGILVTRKVLEAIFQAGAQPAEPGEFTKMAYLNGRIDLSQAEAVMDVISAQNDFALSSSESQLSGSISRKVRDYRERILDVTAQIEAALDDPEHYSIDDFHDPIDRTLREVRAEMARLSDSFTDGRILKEGIHTVILGRPNAGKSSLLNAFYGGERAIVTDVPGTTRDLLEESIRWGGLSYIITDTAGLRDTEDKVEKIGVDRAKDAADRADLILYMIDGADRAAELNEEDEQSLRNLAGRKCIILLNKSDLSPGTNPEQLRTRLEKEFPEFPVLWISARNGSGIDELKNLMTGLFESGKIAYNDEVILTNERQKKCLDEAVGSLDLVIGNLEAGMPEDLLTVDLMDAYASLGKIIGEEVEDDLADRIFEKFCMGK